MTIRASAVVVMLVSAAACSAPTSKGDKELPPVNPMAASMKDGFSTMDRLVEAAKREGTLTVVGLPRGWVNYADIMDRFSDKYGIKVIGVSPEANSQQEIDAATRLRGSKDAPDVFDLSLDVAVANAKRFAPYKVVGWGDVPDRLKDAKGLWYGVYGGYMSIGYDPRKLSAPASYAALAKPGVSVALPGDPLRTASAFSGVMAASLDGGKVDAARGVDLFARIKRAGMLSQPDRAASVVDWDFLNTARAETSARDDKPAWQVTIPRDAVLASYYVQAISKDAPHPAAARLWEEFLLSDEGQNLYLKAYARPARMEAMEMRGTLDKTAAAKLPAATGNPVVLTVPEQDEAKSYLKTHWSQAVG
ncbi:ABC transporter substrate-binding protein [Planotetraspora phitsanulokensis]|uniref:ABC transporter substrate-binding protein n=1 Tax=Planotetraspora phitsanulokensis TaxID=575192 RepID=UPI001EF328C1|nr:extracellular solute-binding protein [Planotetraspora phitsanulokensis]